jgi:hypothetical protein
VLGAALRPREVIGSPVTVGFGSLIEVLVHRRRTIVLIIDA